MLDATVSLSEGASDRILLGGGSDGVSAALLARMRLRGDLGRGPAFPGSAAGEGCSPGEAAGALVLGGGSEPAAARFAGGAVTFEAAEGRTGPTEDAFRRAIEGALDDASIAGSDLDAVFLHAEGIAGQDEAEIRAVDEVAGRGRDGPVLVATKGALGHTRGAAPVVDVVLATRAIETGVLPPTVSRAPLLSSFEGRLPDAPVRGSPSTVLVVAAGSHGGAGALVLEAAS
jgi:3-oxoacyl-[acyl-carrier-protein] synthase II